MIEDWIRFFSEVANYYGIAHRITSVWRNTAEQARLYRTRGRSLPAAPPGQSTHEYGLAFDVVAMDPDEQTILGEIGQDLGLYWGGNFRRSDPVHFQVISPERWKALLNS